MHVYTCDYTEAGSVIFIGGSTSSMDGVQLPQRLDGWGADRMEIRGSTLFYTTQKGPFYTTQKGLASVSPSPKKMTPAAGSM